MTIRIYNSLSRKLEMLVPLEPGHVRMYVCGMTVYDLCHLGHARSMLAFDMVQRWLKTQGFRVTYVRNVTDIDDKIIDRARNNGESIRALTNRMIEALHEDADKLGIERPQFEPRATDYVPQMVDLIERLIHKDLAYVSSSGDVHYATRAFPNYGALSGKSLDDLRAGERVAVDTTKHDALDFVLWKSAKAEEPEEAKWGSPFGLGRPGWHIECSAMANDLLGETFDIHGGGADLQFPHHENEIAQSEGANGKPPAKIWMHNGFVRVDNEKMSKSLGNFFTIREVLQHYDAETLRFFMLRTHYRSPLNYSLAHLDDARASLKRLYHALDHVPPGTEEAIDWNEGCAARFAAAMNEDFGTPDAMAVLFDLATEVNRTQDARLAGLLKSLGHTLGFLQANPKAFLQGIGQASDELDANWIETQIAERAKAKAAKDFTTADAIRDGLIAKGIVLKDSSQGTSWERA